MFKRSEQHLIELLHKDILGIISKKDIKEIIQKEKSLGVFDLDKAYECVWGWVDPK